MKGKQRIGLILGVLCLLGLTLAPPLGGLPPAAQNMAGILLLMAFFWICEVIPMEATSLFPLIGLPLLGITNFDQAAVPYADQTIFLFLGGFFIAAAMAKWNLHHRLALLITRRVGVSPRRLVLGFMISTGFISMWISNTAAALIMYPIGLAIIHKILGDHPQDVKLKNFAPALMLGIAYSASVGGIATLIGTPPNMIFAGSVIKLFPGAGEISFLQWFAVGFPYAVIFTFIIWLYLVRVALPLPPNIQQGGREIIEGELKKLGPWSRGEKCVFTVFLATAFLWTFRQPIEIGSLFIPGWSAILPHPEMIHDSTVAIFMSFLLFLIPINREKKEFALDWETAVKIPWGLLILLGGGFALAKGVQVSGLGEWISHRLSVLEGVNPILVVLIVNLFTIFLSEFTSNTAQATLMMPILAYLAIGLHIHPFLLMVPATIAVSSAFMMPVGTPPNAIAFGSGYLTIPQMVRVGFWLNVTAAVLVTILTFTLICPVLGISPSIMPAWAIK